ncbi:MAG: tetratricopeptide repeat-containing sulfotransferase family protein [Alphaproteobacteria bacterium]
MATNPSSPATTPAPDQGRPALPAQVAQALSAGAHHHEQGRLREAETIYMDSLTAAPGHPDILHLAGLVAYQLGRPEDAVSRIGQAIAADPMIAAFHDNIGLALRALGRLEEAADHHRRAAVLDRHNAGTHFNLGVALQALGRQDEAVASLRRALAIAPDYPEAHAAIASSLARAGKLDQALTHVRRALASRPAYAEGHATLANILFAQGRSEDALSHYREAARLEPENAEAWRNLSVAQFQTGAHDDALASAEKVFARAPGDPDTLFVAAEIEKRRGRGGEAEALYRRLVAAAPEWREARHNLANLLLERGQLAEARAHYEAVLTGARDGEALVGLGRCAQAEGKFGEAEALYREALGANPDLASAQRNLAAIGALKPTAEEIARLETSLARPELPLGPCISGQFALGRLHDSAGHHGAAFAAWRAANELQNRDAAYDPAEHEAVVDASIADFGAEVFAARAARGDPSRAPIFIVGMPRSGTTMAEQILASHPAVAAGGERSHLAEIARVLGWPPAAALKRLDEADPRALAARYLEAGPKLPVGDGRMTDKMPGNLMNLWLAALLFPHARVIHCRRDPMDTGLSCYAEDFGRRLPFTTDLGHIGHYFRHTQRLMAHWREVLGVPIHDFIYEDAVSDPKATIGALLAFCGLTWNDRCLSFHQTERTILSASNWQVRQPLYASSVGRWRRYGSELEPLRRALAEGAP